MRWEKKSFLKNKKLMSSLDRLVAFNDHYWLDPYVMVDLEEFNDIIGRNFRQPVEGLGFDSSPCAHLWRSMIRPNKFL